MVVEVALDFKFVPQPDATVLGVGVGEISPEAIGEHVVAAKRHLRHHARNGKTLPRPVANGCVVVVAAPPLRIYANRSPPDRSPRDLLCRRLQTSADRNERIDSRRIRDRPFECLHAAH